MKNSSRFGNQFKWKVKKVIIRYIDSWYFKNFRIFFQVDSNLPIVFQIISAFLWLPGFKSSILILFQLYL